MTAKSQLPDDFVDGYWEAVTDELVRRGMSEPDAAAAIGGYRAYMSDAGDTIYNDETTASASHAKRWFENRLKAAKQGQVSDTFAALYWQSVTAQLCKAGMTEADAGLAIEQYRERMQKAGPTIYNDQTSESAMWAKKLFVPPSEPPKPAGKFKKALATPKSKGTKQLVEDTLPTPAEIAALPRWVRVAFAARCAQWVVKLFSASWTGAPPQHVSSVESAVTFAELAAARGNASPDLWEDPVEAMNEAAEAGDHAANNAAAAADSAGYAAVEVANNETDRDIVISVLNAVQNAVEAADAWHITIRPHIRRHFIAISDWARANQATDATPCPPIVAGPLWPDGVPEGWPALPTPKLFALTIHVPDEVDLADEMEAMRIAAGFATQFAKLDIVGGGHGLVLKPPLKMSALKVKSRVPVGVGASGSDEEPERTQAGRIEVTIAVTDERDDPSILTAVVQALQGGPVFHDVPDHGAPPPAKPSGKRKALSAEVVKLTERRIEDGLRKAAEELLPPGTEPKFDPSRWVVELQTLWNNLDGLKASGYEIIATLPDDT